MTEITTTSSGYWQKGAWLYAAFAASELLYYFSDLSFIGFLLCIGALVYAYVLRGQTTDPLQLNHLRWMIRTFWIGKLVIVPLCIVLMLACMMIGVVWAALQNTLMFIVPLLGWSAFAVIIFLFSSFWWWRRCWIGWTHLAHNQTIPDVTTWGFQKPYTAINQGDSSNG